MGQEMEYKLRADNEQALLAVYQRMKTYGSAADEQSILMHTRYIDTPSCDLRRARVTLRIRQENERRVITVKTPGVNRCRGEWNLTRQTDTPFPQPEELSALVCAGAPDILCAMTAFEVTCEARFTRTRCMLTLSDGTRVELAADIGVLAGLTQCEPLHELELELYGGSEAALRALAQKAGLPEEVRSKQMRALRLK